MSDDAVGGKGLSAVPEPPDVGDGEQMSSSIQDPDPSGVATVAHDVPAGSALETITGWGRHSAVVTFGSEPLGIVTIGELKDMTPTEPVGSQMRTAVVNVPVGAGERTTLRTFGRAAWRWLRSRRPAPPPSGS